MSSLGASAMSYDLAVDADADEALPPGGLEDPVALGLAVLDERAEDEQPGALRQGQHLVDDLLDASGARSAWPLGQCGMPIRANSSRRWS